MNRMPRQEYPNPQMERKSWLNLNGEWDFSFDFSRSGKEKRMWDDDMYPLKIIVPFCPESKLSGVGFTDFIPAVWYKKKIALTAEQLSGRTFLNIGAADYQTTVYVNGKEIGSHKGGYASFKFEITDYVHTGENTIVVYVEDDVRNSLQPRGKQSEELYSHGCDYTRTTGIWQTVWLEFTPFSYIKHIRFYPDIDNNCIHISAVIAKDSTTSVPSAINATALWQGKKCGDAEVKISNLSGDTIHFTINLSECHLWEPGKGGLYDLIIRYGNDTIYSYFGMREVSLRGRKFYLNGKSVFQRTVLDQGFYPDGIYTAPDENALIKDIENALNMGFNGARLHQKVFEPRFLYHCDRMGYMVWSEYGNWGFDLSDPLALHVFLPEWLEILSRDFNHPSIIGWCPFNETWDYEGRRQIDDTIRIIYQETKYFDTTRPCIDTSGNYHTVTDIYDLHNYIQDIDEFCACYDDFGNGGKLIETMKERQKYDYDKALPVFISEYGGIKWDIDKKEKAAWGYGNAPETEEEFLNRYEKLTDCLLRNPFIMGFCYTQLYDVEQETNGLYTYDRCAKFDPSIIRNINQKTAAIEVAEYVQTIS